MIAFYSVISLGPVLIIVVAIAGSLVVSAALNALSA